MLMSLKIKSATEVPHYSCTDHLHWDTAVILLIPLVEMSLIQVCCYRVGHLEIFFVDLQRWKRGDQSERLEKGSAAQICSEKN